MVSTAFACYGVRSSAHPPGVAFRWNFPDIFLFGNVLPGGLLYHPRKPLSQVPSPQQRCFSGRHLRAGLSAENYLRKLYKLRRFVKCTAGTNRNAKEKGGPYAPAPEMLAVGNAQLHFEYPHEWQTTQPSCLVKPLPQSGQAPIMGSSRVSGRFSPTR